MNKPSYSKNSIGSLVLCLDTETTGSTFGSYEDTFSKYQAISFGAIIATSDTFEPIKELYFKVKFDASKYAWTEEAEKIHGITQDDLEKNGLSPEDAAVELAEFILEHFGTGKVAFLGHNPWFDIAAMEQLLKPFNVMPQLHHVVLDTSALGFITVGKFKSTELFEMFIGGRAEKHNALDDARMTLTVARSVRQLMNMALNELST